ncbi:hypothetical protein [Mycolicibacterium sp. F2034L]|uniref:LppU/SCO3897 family protein n=1 Tax=Mycolicibacterium sp. F2034L TaxID=2926422 RepID=UPI001FF41FF4|nr:hypothetical protein [Mycolicibacterium sp. F2034L]MCK0177609.1 hypothetical protein [Mycolicibacterium sp. F2034L]
MTGDLLADGLTAYRLGQATATLLFPVVGALMLTVGIYRRRAFNRWNRADNERLLHAGNADFDPDPDGMFGDQGTVVRSRPSGRGTILIVVGSMLLVLGALHVMGYVARTAAPDTSTAARPLVTGQCITAEGYAEDRMRAEPVDCSRVEATLQLVSTGGAGATCPDGKRAGTRYMALGNDVRTHCFVHNLREGQCYHARTASPTTATPVECADPTANVMVASRVEGPVEDAACGADATVLAYPEPLRVFCLVEPR